MSSDVKENLIYSGDGEENLICTVGPQVVKVASHTATRYFKKMRLPGRGDCVTMFALNNRTEVA